MGNYDKAFFANLRAWSRSSAAVIAPLLIEAIRPRSVVDIGCGVGTWLAEYIANGVTDVYGIDGDYVDREMLQIPTDLFHPADLNGPIIVNRQFDLAMSVEVGEHLDPARSEQLVAEITALAPVVCFSAAIPFQGGTDHINERWQDDWAAMFAAHGYKAYDLIRPSVWDLDEVAPWYAQNMLIYAATPLDGPLAGEQMPLRVVHPRQYYDRQARVLGRFELLDQAKRTFRRELA